MKTKSLSLILLFACSVIYSQTTFKKGYFVTNSGDKNEVYIQAFGTQAPEVFKFYPTSKKENLKSINKEEISELSVENKAKFLRKTFL